MLAVQLPQSRLAVTGKDVMEGTIRAHVEKPANPAGRKPKSLANDAPLQRWQSAPDRAKKLSERARERQAFER